MNTKEHIDDIVKRDLRIVTTGTGYFKPGLSGRIIGGQEREVFLGPLGMEERFTIPEFTVLLDSGSRREFCQYGRDFVFPNGKVE